LELAQIANINRATIIAIEKGQNTSISTLQQVVEAMGGRLKITVQG
ncbi:MAG: helix-turn-helix domain-containing protein, partial [Proteobacteria bacterium]|nr:helix-turn-helix domain-containing protein [Pseudomonadota bacterium]